MFRLCYKFKKLTKNKIKIKIQNIKKTRLNRILGNISILYLKRNNSNYNTANNKNTALPQNKLNCLYKINTIHVRRNLLFLIWSTSKNITTVTTINPLQKKQLYRRIIIRVNAPIIYFTKRNMLSRILSILNKRDRTLLNNTSIINTKNIIKNQDRNYAPLNPYLRLQKPMKAATPVLEKDPESGSEIMPKFDHSGYPHILLGNSDFKSEKYLEILGSFTTSYHPFEGRLPVFIADTTLYGSKKYQYLHIYLKPRLILKSAVELDTKVVYFPSQEKLNEIIETYKKLYEQQNSTTTS